MAVEAPTCPLCSRAVNPRKLKPLNNVLVCPRCRNGFASRRQGAYIVDYVAWTIITAGLVWLLGVVVDQRNGAPSPAHDVFTLVLGYVVFPLTFLLKDGFTGHSLGKAMTGVQAVDSITREPIGFGRSFKRNLVLLIPVVPLILAFTLIKGWRWGDRWARTVVIWEKYRYHPVFDPRGIVCMQCGYDLTGNTTGRCPECFTPIPFRRPVYCSQCGGDASQATAAQCPHCQAPIPTAQRVDISL